jgi:hypothetical protein
MRELHHAYAVLDRLRARKVRISAPISGPPGPLSTPGYESMRPISGNARHDHRIHAMNFRDSTDGDRHRRNLRVARRRSPKQGPSVQKGTRS